MSNFPGIFTQRSVKNLPDANVGYRFDRDWLGRFKIEPVKGYGIDLNNNGEYDRGKDGVLGYDFDHDGKISKDEVERTNQMMKAAAGEEDLNGDGIVTQKEKEQAAYLRGRYDGLDRNGDGKLQKEEMEQGGMKVWRDTNGDGQIGQDELYNPSNLDHNGISGLFNPGRSLDEVDPHSGTSLISPAYRKGFGPEPLVQYDQFAGRDRLNLKA
ncbi:MAG: hypothetical protein HYU64_01350 [Armatimonadetes bacterium]|nr:hypothetical protein [Armatimonadota bacterium]